jgi:prevent-host-death family protein
MMLNLTIDEIQKNLIGYLHQVAAGESIIITQAGKPIAEIKPVSPTSPQVRPYGLCAGEFTVPDDFDAPLPEEILNSFEGK